MYITYLSFVFVDSDIIKMFVQTVILTSGGIGRNGKRKSIGWPLTE